MMQTTPLDPLPDGALVAALMQRIHRFYRALDAGAADDVAAIMAADGTWHRKGAALTGPEAVRAAVAERETDRVTVHSVLNPVVTPTAAPDVAEARYILMVHEGWRQEHKPSVRLVGILDCHDRFVRQNGTWYVAEKTSSRQLPV